MSVSETSEPVPGRRTGHFGWCVLVFDGQNLLGLRETSNAPRLEIPLSGHADEGGDSSVAAAARVAAIVSSEANVVPVTSVASGNGTEATTEVFICTMKPGDEKPAGWSWFSMFELEGASRNAPKLLDPLLAAVLPAIRPHLIRVPYLNFGESDYLYRFRTEDQRNRKVYSSDERARAIYQSALCAAIKASKRQKERTATGPALLDFGAVRYLLPSHFGFCLGVQNAIERAYETIAENPGRRVYMISELIHNPFVNEDLRDRGLVYLQSDRGAHLTNPATGCEYWNELQKGDIVLTPAFGATDEDKVRLIERGIAVNRYDATCMLVEKVWKAARRFALAGFTIVIHGKSEHEETKATFSNSAKFGPSIVVRDMNEARMLGEIILAPARAEKEALFHALSLRRTPGFDVERDLDRLAVVNQTTLLRNETVGIIDYFESVLTQKFGAGEVRAHLHAKSRGDTLCYATQVNQDALERALQIGADAAIVVGGRNSSNTYQLFRMCKERFAERAFYIQSERHILSRDRIVHYHFPYNPGAPGAGETEERPFLTDGDGPFTVLVTGGASCPDGIIQQVITRINSLFPTESVRPIETVVEEIGRDAG